VGLGCFNSNMVRLKEVEETKDSSVAPGFNSNMVRLKGPLLRSWRHRKPVSIPIWYD